MVAMTSLARSVLVTLYCALVCHGAPVEATSNKVVSYSFDVTRLDLSTQESISFEGNELNARENKYVYYEAEVEIGLRNEKNKVLFDTGSSDLWVIASDAECIGEECKKDGTYSFQDSSTSKNLSIPNTTFYDNFPINLKKQGYINKIAYSLYLNSSESTSGSRLFGDVDNAKYYGELKELSISPGFDLASDFNSVTINGETISNSSEVVLDSGSGYIWLPGNIVDAIGKQLNGTFDHDLNSYAVSCSRTDKLTFNFPQNISITAPVSNFLYPIDVVRKKRPL
ncbi:hypothetical protein CANMA_002642 [Candida margitis]|uniref:uncharacterized protein n=1 Tax=Candida margitis TaxID=1775924 RepID=UPI0022266814|nr:uncharacterized protein CANMA_002642 [Candida margitis]KAI5967874.1 hypothetical protein CANMA_002642 [Candida margitis]